MGSGLRTARPHGDWTKVRMKRAMCLGGTSRYGAHYSKTAASVRAENPAPSSLRSAVTARTRQQTSML